MKKLLVGLLVSLWMPVSALAATWENVSLIDQMCQAKVKGDPDKHPVSCLLKCAGSGYGVMTPDGKYLKLDKAGNELALAALKKTTLKDHVRVNVMGDQKGEEIAVSSLTIAGK
ncbi:MAG TPA: hypothetical protein VML50_14295 [Anaeromyxobacter sp.]|nr:hypothetical protein [Anaeromyxobacter sp.]